MGLPTPDAPDGNDVGEQDDVTEEVHEPRPIEALQSMCKCSVSVSAPWLCALTLTARRIKERRVVARKRILVSLLISKSTKPTYTHYNSNWKEHSGKGGSE